MEMDELIDRPHYLKALRDHRDVDLIKVIVGIRRCGKSSLLSLFHRELSKTGIDDGHIIDMNLESLRYRTLKDYLDFYDLVSSRILSKGRTYLLFDEIQMIPHWEKAVESFRLDYDVDIYITGSNAYLLSNELSTYLSGRYVEIKVYPLSFEEYCQFNHFDNTVSIHDKFNDYMRFGGMPVLASYKMDERLSHDALEGIYSTVILRDIMQRVPQCNQHTLEKIIRFLCSNIGSISSPNRIANVLSSEGELERRCSIANRTVDKYIEYIEKAYFFFSVGRYDIKGKDLLRTLEKYYIIDIGFRHLLLGYRDADRGHLLENIVYIELLRRHYRVCIGKIGELEVDFVAENSRQKIYIQVTESMMSDETRQRELKPLKSISDNYEKIVLSMDRDFIQSYDGIRVMYLPDWLLGEV